MGRLEDPILALMIQTSVKSGGEDLKVPSAKMVSMVEVLTASRTRSVEKTRILCPSGVEVSYPTFRLGIRDLRIHDVGYSRSWVFCTVTELYQSVAGIHQ